MIFQIRPNTFETNSSSTHSLNIVEYSDYQKWCNRDENYLYFSPDENKFFSKEEAEKRIEDFNEFNYNWYKEKGHLEKYEPIESLDNLEICENMNLFTADMFFDEYCEYYETYSERYKINNTDIMAFGYFGNDY